MTPKTFYFKSEYLNCQSLNKLHNHYTGYLPKTKDFFLSGTKIHEKIFDIFDGMFRKQTNLDLANKG